MAAAIFIVPYIANSVFLCLILGFVFKRLLGRSKSGQYFDTPFTRFLKVLFYPTIWFAYGYFLYNTPTDNFDTVYPNYLFIPFGVILAICILGIIIGYMFKESE